MAKSAGIASMPAAFLKHVHQWFKNVSALYHKLIKGRHLSRTKMVSPEKRF